MLHASRGAPAGEPFTCLPMKTANNRYKLMNDEAAGKIFLGDIL